MRGTNFISPSLQRALRRLSRRSHLEEASCPLLLRCVGRRDGNVIRHFLYMPNSRKRQSACAEGVRRCRGAARRQRTTQAHTLLPAHLPARVVGALVGTERAGGAVGARAATDAADVWLLVFAEPPSRPPLLHGGLRERYGRQTSSTQFNLTDRHFERSGSTFHHSGSQATPQVQQVTHVEHPDELGARARAVSCVLSLGAFGAFARVEVGSSERLASCLGYRAARHARLHRRGFDTSLGCAW